MTTNLNGAFAHVTEWVFDLDNTLYPRHCDLFSQIDKQMTAFVMDLTGFPHDDARKLQKDLYREYGTTLRGLMSTHGINPQAFLDHAHDIDYSELPSNPQLGTLISSLPGRKLIYTNGSTAHAENTLGALGIDGIFDGIFDIVASDYDPKPLAGPFNKFMQEYQVDGKRAAMFEDLPRNLEPAKAAGMVTVLITPQASAKFTAEAWEHDENQKDYIDHRTDDLDGLLEEIVQQIVAS